MAAFRNNIFIFKLPPHCTHKLQPLDVGVLGPLQAAFTWGVDTYVGIYGHGLCKADFVKAYLDARDKAITTELITSAFWHCGIHPFNPDIF